MLESIVEDKNKTYILSLFFILLNMNILDNIRNLLYNKDYCISFFNNKIYIYNYISLPIFNDKEINILFETFKIKINGHDLVVIKMEEKELLIAGTVNNIKINYE